MGYLIIAVVLVGCAVASAGCWCGIHEWYGGSRGLFTCGTYYETGSLPGERIYQGWQGTMYRFERHCLQCDRTEYLDTRTHTWVPVNK